jgi:hypothetical protein
VAICSFVRCRQREGSRSASTRSVILPQAPKGFEPRGSRVGASVPRRPHLCSSSGVAISPSVMTLVQKPAATGHQPDPPLWDRPRCCPSASGRATIWPATDVPAGVAVIGLARTYDCRDATLNCAVVCTRVRLVGLREHELVGVNALRAHPEMRHVSRQRQGAGDVSVGRIRAGRRTPCSVSKRVLRNAEVGPIRILSGRGLFIRDEGWICRAASGPIAWLCGKTRNSLSAGNVDFFNLPCAPDGTCPRLSRPRHSP